MQKVRTLAAVALAAALTLTGLAACGNSGSDAETAAAPSAAAASLTIKDPWVKAATAGTMTAAFGTLVNDTGADVTVVSATSSVSPMELHEMAMKDGAMVMRPKEGGFLIKAGGTHELSPGGDHLMMMKPSKEIAAGDEVSFTLTLADGKTVPFTAVAKPFTGAQESYAPEASGMPMDMSSGK
jgi:periplasmic copper chaperone A